MMNTVRKSENSYLLYRHEFPQRNSAGKAGATETFDRMNQGMFLKFAGLSKFCYKEMELPIEKIL